MRRLILLPLLAALPAAATAAEAPWIGDWGVSAESCAAPMLSDDRPTSFAAEGLYGHEWSCDLETLDEVMPGRAWKAGLSCLDMGETLALTELWVLTEPDALTVIDDMGGTMRLTRCGG